MSEAYLVGQVMGVLLLLAFGYWVVKKLMEKLRKDK